MMGISRDNSIVSVNAIICSSLKNNYRAHPERIFNVFTNRLFKCIVNAAKSVLK